MHNGVINKSRVLYAQIWYISLITAFVYYIRNKIQMRATKTAAYYISPIEIGVL